MIVATKYETIFLSQECVTKKQAPRHSHHLPSFFPFFLFFFLRRAPARHLLCLYRIARPNQPIASSLSLSLSLSLFSCSNPIAMQKTPRGAVPARTHPIRPKCKIHTTWSLASLPPALPSVRPSGALPYRLQTCWAHHYGARRPPDRHIKDRAQKRRCVEERCRPNNTHRANTHARTQSI